MPQCELTRNDMGTEIISDESFHELISKRSKTLLGLLQYLFLSNPIDKVLIRPFLGELLSQSMQLEELLDAYGAGNNCNWCYLRSLTAAIKLFSDVSYELLHIEHVYPSYRLLEIESDFVRSTSEAFGFTGDVLKKTSEHMLAEATRLNLSIPESSDREKSYTEELPCGRLSHDCNSKNIETVSETVTLLSTAFLNLAADSRVVRKADKAKPEEYAHYVPEPISEENLRSLQLRFHNLQSLYDTYVSGTRAAELDTDLPVLRGHISVVFHLLKTATLFTHYYERHLNKELCKNQASREPCVNSDTLLDVLMQYSIRHIALYIACAEHLCHEMLKKYAQVGTIEVPVPPYRGFHVRPSTLVSKMALHYGSKILMHMSQDVYDASSPLELFRANEKINAQKRRWLAREINRLKLVHNTVGENNIEAIIRGVVLTLAEQGKLIMYEQPLQLPEERACEEGTVLEKVTDEMAQLLALGKIDVNSKVSVTFEGD
ncbi:MAG: hypothetical protein ACYSWP_21920, partial [Planctomycetota bacterium]